MEAFETIFETLEKSIQRDDFVKLTLSKPLSKSEELGNVYIRLVYIKTQPMYSFTYHYKTRDEVKNYTFQEAKELIINLLSMKFRAGTLFTLQEDLMIFVSKKKLVSFKIAAPTFTNKPPETHDKPKEKRVVIAPYLVHLGIMTADGALIPKMADKYRQINKFLELVEVQLKEVSFDSKINIIDMGSGKGYLTFALYDYLKTKELDVLITGIELRKELVDFCNSIAEKCAYTDLKFEAKPIEEFENDAIDIIIALHACDVATDFAIAKGIKAQAKLIICAPCCHKQVRQQVKGIQQTHILLKHGIFKERMFEMITDSIRGLILEKNHYNTKIFEFISSEHTHKNVMIVGVKHTKRVDVADISDRIEALKQEFGITYQELEKLV